MQLVGSVRQTAPSKQQGLVLGSLDGSVTTEARLHFSCRPILCHFGVALGLKQDLIARGPYDRARFLCM